MKLFLLSVNNVKDIVAPARERGLKSVCGYAKKVNGGGRSREGAWIEIRPVCRQEHQWESRSREGAWIEIGSQIVPHDLAKQSLPRGSVD